MAYSIRGMATKVAAAHMFFTTLFTALPTINVEAETVPDAKTALSESQENDNKRHISSQMADFSMEEAKVKEFSQAQKDTVLTEEDKERIKQFAETLERQKEAAQYFSDDLDNIKILYDAIQDAHWMDHIALEHQHTMVESINKEDNIAQNIVTISHIYNDLVGQQENFEASPKQDDILRKTIMGWLSEAKAQRELDHENALVRINYNESILEAANAGEKELAVELTELKELVLKNQVSTLPPGERAIALLRNDIVFMHNEVRHVQEEQETLTEEYEFVENADWRELLPDNIYNDMVDHRDLIERMKEQIKEEKNNALKKNLEKELRDQRRSFDEKEEFLQHQVKKNRPEMLDNIEDIHKESVLYEIELKQDLEDARAELDQLKDDVRMGRFEETSQIALKINDRYKEQNNKKESSASYANKRSSSADVNDYAANAADIDLYPPRYSNNYTEGTTRTRERYNEWHRTNIHRRGYRQSDGVYYRFNRYDPNIGHPFAKRERYSFSNRKTKSEWISWNGYHGSYNHNISFNYFKQGNWGQVGVRANILDVRERNGETRVRVGGGRITINPTLPFKAPRPD